MNPLAYGFFIDLSGEGENRNLDFVQCRWAWIDIVDREPERRANFADMWKTGAGSRMKITNENSLCSGHVVIQEDAEEWFKVNLGAKWQMKT